ncbi:MAG: hypothetical protein ACI4MY_03900 [Christensenellales bacterium]
MTKKELTTQEKIKKYRRSLLVDIISSICDIIGVILSGYLLSEGFAYDGIFEIVAGLIFLIENASVLSDLIFFTLYDAKNYKEAKKELIKENEQ